ncbi:DUF4184 family protein [Nevskia sp.]|uniref:DUF4184 family protein n=1 Tax=Nevskia sp. TaxID=1929292 RepID=UPI0025F3DB9A|nr:DUF4184 family protein [Nevskia sp.]
MPFTLAHPAAVVPLRRLAPLSALVIGSMVADAGHFLSIDLPRGFTHGRRGLLMYSVPAGWLVWLIFQRLLREPLLALAPTGFAARLPAEAPLPRTFVEVGRITLGLVLGWLTHVVWDRMTTINFSLPYTASLIAPLTVIRGVPIYPQDLLRHGSAMIGLALLALWLLRWWQRTPPAVRPTLILPITMRISLIAVSSLAIAAFALAAASGHDSPFAGRTVLTRAVRAALPAIGVTVLGYAVIWQLWRRKSAR